MTIETPKTKEKKLDNQSLETKQKLEKVKLETLEIWRKKLLKEAPLYKENIKEINDPKKIEEILKKINFAKIVLGEKFYRLFIRGEEVNGYKVEGLKLRDLLRFLNELENEEIRKELSEAGVIILTLNELKQLEKVIATEDIKDDLDFIRSQLKENVSSYDILSKDNLFISKIQKFLEKNCKGEEKECSVDNFLNRIDNQIFKFLQEVLPKDASLDTLRNMATGLNLGFMLLFNDLDKGRKKIFLEFLAGFNELVSGKSTLDKLEGLVNTGKYGYEGFKMFSYIYDFIKDLKDKAKELNIKGEEVWEEYTNLNNPTKFAKYFEKYILAKIDGKPVDNVINEMFSGKRQGSGLDFELKKAKQNREIDEQVIKKLNSFSKDLTEQQIMTIYNLTNNLDKVVDYKRRFEKKIDDYTDKFKKWGEKLASLLCIGQAENCKNEIVGIFYKIYSLIVDLLNALGLHIEKKWRLNVENNNLKKFNMKFADSFVKAFIDYDSDSDKKEYGFNKHFKETVLNDYLPDLRNKKFKSIQIEGSLSEETMKWLHDQGIDISDIGSISKKLIEILKDKKRFVVIPNIKEKVKKVISFNGGKLNLNLTELDYLLKEAYNYGNLTIDLYRHSEEYVERKLEGVDKAGIKEIAEQLDIPEEVVYAILVKESGKPAQIGKLSTRLEKHKYEEFKRKGYNDDIAKKLATSYGSFQIMGFNYKRCGYNSVDAFVKALKNPNYEIRRRAQIESFVNFVKSDSELWNAMRTKNWQVIAKKYNGPAYKMNNYDLAIRKLAEEYRVA